MNRRTDYENRLKAKGWKKVCLWVPGDMVERLKKYAEKLRKESEKQ